MSGISGERFELRLGEPGYPERLAAIGDDAPEVLYGIGNPDALRMPILAVVGARRCTDYGIECAEQFTRNAMGMGYTIVSGGALGIDTAAHDTALKNGGKTVAVLGGAVDRPYTANATLYDAIARAGGCVVSEQPWGMYPRPQFFVRRNRIIAGLSQAMLVVEAGLPSGTLSACDRAVAYGRPVLAVPGNIDSPQSAGTNHLIAARQANAVTCLADMERWLEVEPHA